MIRYTYAGIRIINMETEKEDRHMSRVMCITRAPCQRYVLNSQEKTKENKKVVMNTKRGKKKPRSISSFIFWFGLVLLFFFGFWFLVCYPLHTIRIIPDSDMFFPYFKAIPFRKPI